MWVLMVILHLRCCTVEVHVHNACDKLKKWSHGMLTGQYSIYCCVARLAMDYDNDNDKFAFEVKLHA
jgi:hypothetical protein